LIHIGDLSAKETYYTAKETYIPATETDIPAKRNISYTDTHLVKAVLGKFIYVGDRFLKQLTVLW